MGTVDIVACPLFQAFPISITREPSGVSNGNMSWQMDVSHSTYSMPCLFPYFFGCRSGKGGDVKMRLTLPRRRLPEGSFKKSSMVELYALPSLVVNWDFSVAPELDVERLA